MILAVVSVLLSSALADQAPPLPGVRYSEARATVVLFVAATCPCSMAHVPEIKQLAETYGPRQIQFVALRPIAKDHDPLPLGLPEIRDGDHKYADAFKALKTPHAYLVSKTGQILYSGGITDRSAPGLAERYFLRDVLAAFDAKKEIPWKKTRTLGCLIRGP